MSGLGAPELIVILLVVLLLFGAKKLPELAKSVGKSISEFKKGRDEGNGPAQSAGAKPAQKDDDQPKSA